MEIKYMKALKAGAIGGILLIILSIINFAEIILSTQNMPIIEEILGIVYFLIVAIIAIITGALSVRFADSFIKDAKDVDSVSRVSGVLAGAFYGVTQIIIAIIRDIMGSKASIYLASLGIKENFNSIGQVFFGAVICFPVWLLIIMLLANVGARKYADIILWHK